MIFCVNFLVKSCFLVVIKRNIYNRLNFERSMTFFKKMVAGFCATSVVVVSSAFFVQKKVSDSIEPYVRSHLEEIMKDQEVVLGIKHMGVPEISFEDAPCTKGRSFLASLEISGEYVPKEDKIYLPLVFKITPEKKLINTLASWMTFGSISNVKEVLDHELGHFYVDKLSEALGRGNCPDYSGIDVKTRSGMNDYMEKSLGIKVVSEGIARYFDIKMNDREVSHVSWPRELEDFSRSWSIFDVGYKLVKPIIDKHGREGIEYLITNFPSSKEIFKLDNYQNRALEYLFDSSNKKN